MASAVPTGSAPPTPPPELTVHERRQAARRRRVRRAAYSLLLVGVVLGVGTVGFHSIAGVDWVNAFYFESMLATGQGPPFSLTTDSAKLFASLMAFVSVGSVLTSIVFTLGPIVARAWREWTERVEHEVRHVEEEFRHLERPR